MFYKKSETAVLKMPDYEQLTADLVESNQERTRYLKEEKSGRLAVSASSKVRDRMLASATEMQQLPILLKRMKSYMKKNDMQEKAQMCESLEKQGKDLAQAMEKMYKACERYCENLNRMTDHMYESVSLGIKEAAEPEYEHGFDLTSFDSVEDWEKVLASVKLKGQGKKDNSALGFVWKNKDIYIVTGNNPITGEHGRSKTRPSEPGYASYIGLEGKKDMVMKAVTMIKKLGNIKGESKGSREFI